MPWKERSVVEERMRFVLRLKDSSSSAIPYVTVSVAPLFRSMVQVTK